MKLVGNGRIRKKEEGWQDLRGVNFVLPKQLGIVMPVAYLRDPYKKKGTFLAAQNRGHITTIIFRI